MAAITSTEAMVRHRCGWKLALIAVWMSAAVPAGAGWRHYTAATDGFANDQVLSVFEVADGSLLFGTENGATRYDGRQWWPLRDSLPDLRVKDALCDRAGRWWYATQGGGVARWDGTRWARWQAGPGGVLPSNQVQRMLQDHRGELWFGTPSGLVRHDPVSGQWTTYPAGPGSLVFPNVWDMIEARDGRLWIATPAGVSVLDSTRTQWTSYTADPAALARDSVLTVAEGPDGAIWFGTGQGAFRFGGGQWTRLRTGQGLASDTVYAIVRDGTGHLWLGMEGPNGRGAVQRFDGRTMQRMPADEPNAPAARIHKLYVDHAGNLWVTTLGSGVYRYDGTRWRDHVAATASPGCPLPESISAPFDTVITNSCLKAALLDHSGELWVATLGGGINRLTRSGGWTATRSKSGLPVSDSVSALAEDPAGRLWFGFSGAGVSTLDSTRTAWTWFGTAAGLPASRVTALFATRAGRVWAGTAAGPARLDGMIWEPASGASVSAPVEQFLDDDEGRVWMLADHSLWSADSAGTGLRSWTTADGLGDDWVNAILRSRDGAMWFATNAGLSRFAGGTWTSWSTIDGVPTLGTYGLGEDRSGRILIGTLRRVAVWDGNAFTLLPEIGVGSVPVYGFLEDAAGTLWCRNDDGVLRWSGREWRQYKSADGLATNGVTQLFEDTQQRVWMVSSGAGACGLTEHEPDRTSPQAVFSSQPPALSALRSASFVFGAAFGETADLEFSTSWDGSSWSGWSTATTLGFEAVPDGPHVFSVRARDWVGNVDTTAATWRFEVDATPPAAVVSAPAFGQPVRGRVAVRGTAADARFRDFVLLARPAGAASWSGPGVVTLGAGSGAVNDDTLATWDTAGLADGNWELRLAVQDTLGLVGVAQVRVIVDNLPPFANVTSPVTVVASAGGEVFTTNAEAHLFFPPGAFSADAIVTVDSVATGGAPDTLTGGVRRAGPAWTIGWGGGTLAHPATLDLRPYAPAPGLAIWREDTPGRWSALGGTESAGAWTLALSSPGTFALFAGAVPVRAERALSAISLTPRAFSPSGAFAGRDVAIAFTLSRSGTAAVRIYNRAGRLVRTVAGSLAGVAGENLVRWDGRGDDGRMAEPGIYLVSVEALGLSRTQALGVVR